MTEQLALAGIRASALVREGTGGSLARQKRLALLQSLGVRLVHGSYEIEVERLAEILTAYDTVVCLLKGIQTCS